MVSPKRRSQIAAVLAASGGSSRLAMVYDAQSRMQYGVPAGELERNRDGYAEDPVTEAALRFAHAAFVTRGRLEPRDVRAARRRGASDDDLAALAALAAQVASEIIALNAREALSRHGFTRGLRWHTPIRA
jgi:hypothetical protein